MVSRPQRTLCFDDERAEILIDALEGLGAKLAAQKGTGTAFLQQRDRDRALCRELVESIRAGKSA